MSLAFAQQTFKETILVIKEGQKVIYSADGIKIKEEDLLRHFGQTIEHYGRNSEVEIIFDENLTFKNLSNIIGIIQKAGIAKIKTYIFTKETQRMIEMKSKGTTLVAPQNILRK